jgi:hypothetical protein
MKLENWSIVQEELNPYQPPEMHRQCLHGKVYHHPDHADGTEITTSVIVDAHNRIVTTRSGSEYILGEVDPEYEKQYPNAKQRLFKTNLICAPYIKQNEMLLKQVADLERKVNAFALITPGTPVQEHHFTNDRFTLIDIGVAFNDNRVWVCVNGIALLRAKIFDGKFFVSYTDDDFKQLTRS